MSKKSTVSKSLYDLILEKIINMDFEPGSRISEQKVSEIFNVSRTPVKNAFIRLEHDGLISVEPQIGTYVSKIDTGQLRELLSIRLILEQSVIPIVFENIRTVDIKELELNIERQLLLIDEEYNLNTSLLFRELDNEFHAKIFEIADKSYLWDYINKEASHFDRYRILSNSHIDVSSIRDRIAEHQNILKMLINKDKAIFNEYDVHILQNLDNTIDSLLKQFPFFIEQ